MSDEAPTTDPGTGPTVAPRSQEADDLGGRLHPSVIAMWSLRGVAPLAALWIASGAVERTVGLAALALIVGGSWVRWWRFTWRIERGHLVIERGLLQRTRRVIPIARIQAVQTVRKIQHRVFGVVGLHVEAIGGSETEGQLDALDVDVAGRVQQALLHHTATDPAVPSPARDDARDAQPATAGAGPPGAVLAHCTPRRLLLAGVTGGRVGVAAAIIGLAQQAFGDRVTDAALSARELGLVAAILLAVAAVVVAFALSLVATAVAYWDFTVRRDGSLLRLHRGLLDERRDTVPIARVQSITVEQNVLRRALGLAAVKMTVAGRAGDGGDLTSTLLPIGSRHETMRLVGEVFDVEGLGNVELTPMPAGARRRRLARAAFATLVVTGIGLVTLGWPRGLVGLLTAAVTVPVALASYRALGWARHRGTLVARSGWLVQRFSVTPVVALQSIRLASSPFQRRQRLATLQLEVARSRGARDPRLLDIATADGAALLHALSSQAQPVGTDEA